MKARPDALADLAAELQAFGLVMPRGGLVADGEIHRCADARHHRARNDAGWYVAHALAGGLVVAAFGSWLDGRSTKWNSRGESVARLSSADREAVADQRRKADAEKARRAREVEQYAGRAWSSATPCSSHAYLTSKAVKSHGLRVDGEGRLLIPLADMSGNVRSLQRIGADGKKLYLYGTDRSTALQYTIGNTDGAATIVVVEGYATGATVYEITGLPVVITFDAAGMKRAAPLLRTAHPDALLIFAGDNDASGTGQNAARDAAATVGGLAFCPPTKGHDWNDHAQAFGGDDVRARFAALLAPHHPPTPGLPINAARVRLQALMGEAVDTLLASAWSRDLDDTPPPVALLAATLGLGKTETAIILSLALIGRGVGPIAIAAPEHKLNRQLRDRARAAATAIGSTARIEMRLGREADNPDAPGKMCFDLDAVRDVLDAGLDAQSTVCERRVQVGRGDDGKPVYETRRCPHFDACPYQAQAAKSADLWLGSHAALGHTKPSHIGQPALLFIDENPVGAMLRGTGGLPGEWITVGLADVAPYVTTAAGGIDKVRSAALEVDHPELVAVRRHLDAVRRINGLGNIRREALGDLLADELRRAAGQAKGLIYHPPNIVPGMAPTQRRELLKAAAGNRARLREAKLYDLLADFIERPDQAPVSGHVSLATFKDTRGNRHEAWRLHYLAPINAGWHAPTVMLDATARDDYRPVLRALFPGLRDDLGGEVKAATPHLRVTVVTGRSMSLQAIGAARCADSDATLTRRAREEAARVLKWSRELGGGTGLVTGNKTMVEAMRASLPDTIGTAHFNALRGRDDWRTARFAETLGRPMPSPRDVEVMAGAILGRAIEPAGDWYERTARPLVVDGRVAAVVEGVRHPDPIAEALRWSICEAEVLQAGGRLRPAERTADNPADWRLTGCPIPDELTISAVETWQAPTPADEMLAAGGVALLSAPAAFRVYPALWPSVDAAKKALQRAADQTGTIPYRDHYKEMSPSGLTVVRYRLAGERQRPAVALVDPARVSDPAAWLAAQLGPLAYFDVDGGPEAPPPGASLPAVEKIAPMADLAPELPGQQLSCETAPVPVEPPLVIGLDPPVKNGVPAGDPLSDYSGGIMPGPVVDLVRSSWRASPYTQQQLADQVGISRPQLANALQGRFGLSVEAAARLRAVVASLPASPQGRLL